MFMFATTTLARKAEVMSTWLAIVSYLAATFLLVSTTFHPALLLVFPAWTVLISVLLLVRAGRLSDKGPMPQAAHVPPAEGATT
jgi:hypothetical protein